MKSSRRTDKKFRHVVENLTLLQGGRAYFPAMIRAMDNATAWIQLETYLFDTFGAGADVASALVRAAERGVRVQVLVDGIGTRPLPPEWQEKMRIAGVEWCVYSPLASSWAILQPLAWRRLHRKLCVIDQRIVFCGGINILDDFYDPNHGPLKEPRFDFAISATGDLAVDAAEAVTLLWWRVQAGYSARQRHFGNAWEEFKAAGYGGRTGTTPNPTQPAFISSGLPAAHAALVLRDNLRNRSSIEKSYLKAIGQAKNEVLIANAYFLPGGKLRRALISAARRGVKVTVLLQGKYEYFMQFHASRPVYDALLKEGIEIYAYAQSFLHAKVAVIDGHWATVGSSNLDPLSLLLAREANVVIEGTGFAGELRDCLNNAMNQQSGLIEHAAHIRRPRTQRMLDWFAYGIMRSLLWITGTRY
jgi:cardiolipin synthase A/B